MTNEEARIRLKNLKSDAELYDGKAFKLHLADSEIEALDMAIKALEQNESAEEWYKLFVEKLDEQQPCEKSMNKAYEFGKNKGVGVYWNKQTDTVELPEAVFRYILSLVPTDKEIEE